MNGFEDEWLRDIIERNFGAKFWPCHVCSWGMMADGKADLVTGSAINNMTVGLCTLP